jgi:hypothetical protein
MHDEHGLGLLAKIAGIWAMIGVTSWSEAASFAAFAFTMYLLLRKVFLDFRHLFVKDEKPQKPRDEHETSFDWTNDETD